MRKKVEIAVKTDVGMVRTENQDHFCVVQPDDPELERKKGAMVVVADGMGGHSGGTIASHTAIDAIYEAFKSSNQQTMHDLLEESITQANQAVRDKAEANPQIRDMGTTCVSALVRGRYVLVAHLGDSRCYMFRNGDGEIVTRDHTYLNELVEIGLLTPEQAEGHPDKNIITRCVGMSNKLEIDFNRREIQPGDVLLMCSDGLSNFVKIEEMDEILRSRSAEEACDHFIELANGRGGDDNITVAVIKIHEVPDEDEDLARLDADDAQYSSKMTPVINRDDLDPELVVDADADTAEGTKRPDVRAAGDPPQDDVVTKRTVTAAEAQVRPPSGPSLGFWYWLIGAEIVVLLLIQVWITWY